MKKPCVIIDVENTLIDVSHRKFEILKNNFSYSGTIEEVKKDITLCSILGDGKSNMKDNFYSKFNAPHSVSDYPSPLFDNAKRVIDNLIGSGIEVIFITGRTTNFQEVITNELKNNGLNMAEISIYFNSDLNPIQKSETIVEFKKNIIAQQNQIHNIIAVIGDRTNDVIAAKNSNIPSIILLSSSNQMPDIEDNPIGFQICTNWEQIGNTIKAFTAGDEEMKALRRLMIDNYSKWLSDIDHKLSICVCIATILCGVSTTGIIKSVEGNNTVTIIFMYIIFLSSFLSLIFSIRGFTSRNTSGKNAGKIVKSKKYLKQCFTVLLGKEDNEEESKKYFEQFKQKDPVSQSMEHRNFFYNKYNSYEPDILWNYRLLDIWHSNYSKLTGERFASSFLIISIITMVIGVSIIFITYFVNLIYSI